MPQRFNLGAFAYAHRGLWDDVGRPENSLAAFEAAAMRHVGIELDVRPSADGVPIVFHDRDLKRLTGRSGAVADQTAATLSATPLLPHAQSHTIPTLEAVLALWPAGLPLLCEIKIDGETDPIDFTHTVCDLLSRAEGYVAAMSFSTAAVSAIPTSLQRGQLIEPRVMLPDDLWQAQLNTVDSAQIDFIACACMDAEKVAPRAEATGLPLVVWTVQSEAQSRNCAPFAHSQIFEGFDPDIARAACRPKS
ncbi:MAG: glycerophosphodiester phosphodiesterase family protein [Pseudomonadota bacterium]